MGDAYQNEPRSIIFLVDNKSFYASVESVARGLDPLKTTLVVMSEQENTNGGLILATSPQAKKRYGLQSNVSRQRDLPNDPHLIVVPPRMNLYIQENLTINNIFREFVADEDLWPYSIDESILDMTKSWRLFGPTPRAVALKIQATINKHLGLAVTIGIGDNPVQAKIALDIYAKHTTDRIGEIHYETVPQTIWKISELTDVWGIGHRTAAHLNRLGIFSMDQLAHANPFMLKEEMGLIGSQLFAVAWGIDRTRLSQRVPTRAPSIGNSQVLPRDYHQQQEIELVLKEIGEQVGARLRHHHQKAGILFLGIGFSYAQSQSSSSNGFSHAQRITPTNRNTELVTALLALFRTYWDGEIVRNIAVFTGDLAPDSGQQLNMFEPLTHQIKSADLERTMDQIRAKFGFTALVYAKSKLRGGTAIQRATLVGGHNGGNSYD